MDSAANAFWQWRASVNPFGETECKLLSQLTRRRMEELFARHMPLGLLQGKDLESPRLHIGASNICEGWSAPIEMTAAIQKDRSTGAFHKLLLASASIPPLFQPTEFQGNWYWDGLYSHNPPIECLANAPDVKGRGCPATENVPDEIWGIQINPEQSAHPPRTVAELLDRRNELTGNLTLAAEMYHIDAMNWLVRNRKLKGYKDIRLRMVRLDLELDFASKYDRSRHHIETLLERGRSKAADFFRPSSLWSMGEIPGVDKAGLAGARMLNCTRRLDISATSECTTPCPASGLCKTFPQIGPWQQSLFDAGQKCFELPLQQESGRMFMATSDLAPATGTAALP